MAILKRPDGEIVYQVLGDGYQVVIMDQRNAGASQTAIEAGHGWYTFADDHLALIAHSPATGRGVHDLSQNSELLAEWEAPNFEAQQRRLAESFSIFIAPRDDPLAWQRGPAPLDNPGRRCKNQHI